MESKHIVLYLLHVYRSAIQGLGNTLIPLASGIAEFVMRVSVALLLPKWIGEEGIYYAEICAWSSALEELKQNLRVALARGCCNNVTREEVHSLIDEILDEYEK